ncbi:unnamed protein product [Phyllotreta striolata]|uniref:Intimal thickness related receptor IRP domain-containing protein n=1 Tax=Phyllotreta striolata TaxID=444603 RepID=A0A9N9TPN7_PHYSR|nr:unnamed protein product [Phyllotreta striolata]
MFKFLLISALIVRVESKYIEGELRTNENWAFLARFCFLSEDGQFEYQIDFDEDQGDPNLLLYYDTDDQWPAVYKTNKTCDERESVLNVRQNQIVNLTARIQPYRELSGCNFVQTITTSRSYTLIVPTLPPVPKTNKSTSTISTYFYEPSTTQFTTEMYNTSPSDSYSSSTESTTLDYETTDASIETTIGSDAKELSKRSTFNKERFTTRQGRTVTCHNARRFRSSRERWWFIAVSNCRGTKGISIKYKILMTNGPPGDYWHEHLSADEFYILPVLMAFTVSYSFLLLGIVVCTIELKSRQLLHTTYKIFVYSVIVQLFGVLFVSSCYLKLAVSGFLAAKVRRFGQILMGTSETSFVLLLLLLAKGYTITRGRLPLPASIKLTVFMCLYAVTYAALFIYEANVFDPGEVLYLYESPAGYGLITLRILAWCMFIYSTIFTLKRYPEKGNFYYPFNIFGTLWFVAGPAFILSANTYIDKWVRESVVFAVLLFITFGGHLMFLILTMPSVANKNFPYHVRTTQIGIMEFAGGRLGNSTMEQFGHHVYEPTTNGLREQTVIVPLTRMFQDLPNHNVAVANGHAEVNLSDNEDVENREIDERIGNVLNWSTAKNATASADAAIAKSADKVSIRSTSDYSRRSSGEDGDDVLKNTNNFEEYLRDVPIELFTVSKMMANTNGVSSKQQHRQHQQQHSD